MAQAGFLSLFKTDGVLKYKVIQKKGALNYKNIKKLRTNGIEKYFAEKWSTETAATTADFAKNILESL